VPRRGSQLCVALALIALSQCGDAPRRSNGAACASGDQCASGLCSSAICLDPDADDDGDDLINGLEGAIGTDPLAADTDADGAPDGVEVADVTAPADADGDGKPDAVESKTADADGDCVADELDPDDGDAAVPGDACADADCDGELTAGEACDDGNTDAADGCDRCEALPLPVSTPGREARIGGTVAGLASGGFVATWTEGSGTIDPAFGGRTTAFFGADGAELRRLTGFDAVNTQRHFRASTVGLRGGGAAVAWHRFVDGVFHLEAQRFTDVGDEDGAVLDVRASNDLPSVLRLVPRNGGAWALVYTLASEPGVVTLRFVDGAGGLLEQPTLAVIGSDDARFGAHGLADDTVGIVFRDSPSGALVMRRYEAFGGQVGNEAIVVPSDAAPGEFIVAPLATGGGFGVIFLTLDEPVGLALRRFDAAGAPTGEVEPIVADTGPDCSNRGLLGGFLAGGEAFAVVAEENCDLPRRGWLLRGSDDVVPLALPGPGRGNTQIGLAASTYAGGAVFQWIERNELVAYLTGFSRSGARTYLRSDEVPASEVLAPR
jgi:hypothetical protein